MKNIFFAYDKAFERLPNMVEDLFQPLSRLGYAVETSSYFHEEESVEHAIKRANLVVGLIQEDDSPNVFYELGYAAGQGKKLLLVCFDDMLSLPGSLSSVISIYSRDADAENILAKIRRFRPWPTSDAETERPKLPLTGGLDVNQLLDNIMPDRFERLAFDIFEHTGTNPVFSRDRPYDFELSKFGPYGRTLVECKLLSRDRLISLGHIQEFNETVIGQRAEHGIFMSPTKLSTAAQKFANTCKLIEIWDRKKIVHWVSDNISKLI